MTSKADIARRLTERFAAFLEGVSKDEPEVAKDPRFQEMLKRIQGELTEEADPKDHGHDHPHDRERGDLRNPDDIVGAVAEVVKEMGEHHKGTEPLGFAFVLVHRDNAKKAHVIHGAGGGDQDAVFEAVTRRHISQKLGVDLDD